MHKISSILFAGILLAACTNTGEKPADFAIPNPEESTPSEPETNMQTVSLKPLSVAEEPFSPHAFNSNLEQPQENLTSMLDIFNSFPFGYFGRYNEEERNQLMNNSDSTFLEDEANHYLSFKIPNSQTDTFVFTVFLNKQNEWLVAYSQKLCPAHCTQTLGFYQFKGGKWIDVSADYLAQLELNFRAKEDGEDHTYYYQLPKEGTEIKIVEGLYEASDKQSGEAVAALQWDGEGFLKFEN